MPDMFATRALFGGAITVSLPSTFTDVSEIRQVPDNQEVYIDRSGFSSISIDLLERVSKEDTVEALQYHLSDITDDDANSTTIWGMNQVGTGIIAPHDAGRKVPIATLLATSLPGEKMRGRANEPVFVAILLVLIRLESVGTDVVVSVNVPHVEGEFEEGSVDLKEGRLGLLIERAMGWREEICRTFEVVDWALFGGDEGEE